jgi:putative transposase
VLGVARSHIANLTTRSADWTDGRTARISDPAADLKLVDAAKAEIGDLLTYGYRRAGALVNRRRTAAGLAAFNHKRFYRVMKAHALLLPKAPKRVVSARVHDGEVAVKESNRRWCSDGFEIGCDTGEVVTGVFLKDCCDREIISWRAWSSRGLPGEPVRDMLIEGVESRFGEAKVAGDVELEFLSDNGGAYQAKDTHALVKDLDIKSVHAPVCSPQSNGMAQSFVNTFKRDYVSQIDRSSAAIVLRQMPAAFDHFNEVHPHSALGYRSPRMFRKELIRRAQIGGT